MADISVIASLNYRKETADKATKGGDNKLEVFMASYTPDIRCNSSPGPPSNSCIAIFADMHADKVRKTFGHLPDERVQARLPVVYKSG